MDGIADYEFVRPLAPGRYLARTPARLPVTDEFVAVRVLDAAVTPEVFRAAGELRAYASVRSTGMVRLYDAGHHGGLMFCAVEHVAGGSLGAPAEPLTRAAMVEAVAGAATAAHDLHEAGRPATAREVADAIGAIA